MFENGKIVKSCKMITGEERGLFDDRVSEVLEGTFWFYERPFFNFYATRTHGKREHIYVTNDRNSFMMNAERRVARRKENGRLDETNCIFSATRCH